ARAGVRGAGLCRVVTAQPLGADPDPALQARFRAGNTRGASLPRSRVQPLPHLLLSAARRPRGDRAGLRAARADGDEPLPTDGRPRVAFGGSWSFWPYSATRLQKPRARSVQRPATWLQSLRPTGGAKSLQPGW